MKNEKKLLRNLKIDFWGELWKDLILNFLKRSYGLTLYSPHILIEEIIIEIEENQFRNKDNKAFFYTKLSEFLEHDEVVNSHLKSEFNLLRQTFSQDRPKYILSLCHKIDSIFKNGKYFESTLALIKKTVLDDSEIESDFIKRINYYSQNLIVEFIQKGYNLEDIKSFLDNVFDDYRIEKKYIHTNFPHDISSKNYLNSDDIMINPEEYYQKIQTHMDSLDDSKRIDSLKWYFNKKTEKVKYIFVVKGIKGNIEKKIAGVTFYNPDFKKFATKDDSTIGFENLQRHESRNEKFIQACVEINHLLPKSSAKKAISKIENALDILSCYLRFNTEVKLDDNKYITVDKNGWRKFASMGKDSTDPVRNYRDVLNLEDEHVSSTVDNLNKYKCLFEQKHETESTLKIKNAIHWNRKGESSNKDEDKMLNYWIAIENLFNKSQDINHNIFSKSNKKTFHLIQEILSSHQVFRYVYDYGWELHKYCEQKYSGFNSNTKIPKRLIEKAQLSSEIGKTIYLNKFIAQLPELRKYETDIFILEKIDLVIKFYNDSSYAKKLVLEHIKQVRNDVLMIYRFRNLIVHNAHFDHTLLPYLVWKMKLYCGDIIREFVRHNSSGKELDEMILNIHIEKEKLLMDFDNNDVDLFSIEIN